MCLKYLSQFLDLFHLYFIVIGRFAARMGRYASYVSWALCSGLIWRVFSPTRLTISWPVSYVLPLYLGRFTATMGLLGF